MVKLKLELVQDSQVIDLPVALRWVASSSNMQTTVGEGSKLAGTIKLTVCSKAEADRLLVQEIIIGVKTQLVDRLFDIASDVQYPICGK